MTHFKITQASLISLFTTVVGFLVAFVPNFASDQQVLIAAGTSTLSAAFLIANAVHAFIASKVSVSDLEKGIRDLAKDEIGKVNLNGLVQDALKGVNLDSLVRDELSTVLSRAAGTVTTAAPLAGGPVTASAAPAAPETPQAPPAA